MFKEFKEFALKGNMMDLAVGVIIGAAFKGIVDSLVNDILMPIINACTGGLNFNDWAITIGKAKILYGTFISNVLNFIIMAFIIFLLVKGVAAIEALAVKGLKKKEEEAAPAAPTQKVCPFCKSEIAIDATRCPHCTSELKD